jgi:hypothetical protein
MAAKITERGFFETCWLKLNSRGVVYNKSALIGGAKRIAFREIDYVLMSDDHVLTIGRGTDLFSIKTKPGNARHAEAMGELVRQLEAANAALRRTPA